MKMETMVVDTNAVAAALVREGMSRRILLLSGISFFAPDFLREELDEHKAVFLAKSGLSEEDFEKVMDAVLASIVQIPAGSYLAFKQKALELTPDHDDWPFLALAISLSCPVWSNDREMNSTEGSPLQAAGYHRHSVEILPTSLRCKQRSIAQLAMKGQLEVEIFTTGELVELLRRMEGHRASR